MPFLSPIRFLRAAHLAAALSAVALFSLGGCQKAKPPTAAPKFKTLAEKNDYEIWKAMRESDADELKRLVKSDSKLANASNGLGTLLHRAAQNDTNPALCEILLQAGANPNVFNKKGQTPLLIAVRGRSNAGKTRVVKLLLAKGANVNAAHKTNGATPLHSAVVVGDLDVVKLLLKAGANPNLATKKGQTPLQQVIKSQNDLKTNAPLAGALAKFTNSENFPAIEQLLPQAGGK